ncbi:MAG: prephenate dehydratase [Woeseia sp.]|nr:prephenate dehydratase [Woeseia sp.]NNE62114.1 prephenate dehydratase [Woeseia sp.]
MSKKPQQPAAVDLDSIRKRIDEVDQEIHALINERAKYAQQVGLSKGELAAAVEYYRPEREAEVLRRVLDRNKGPLKDEEILRLFREIMSACLAQQEPLKIGYLGPEGTFTQSAVYKHFGHSVRALPFGTIDEVFQEVESSVADFGVVPIENSTEGTVNNTLDMFLSSPLKIGGEIELRIEQHLLGRQAGLEKIERICAHQQALAQCRGWLREHLPQVELIGVSSNAVGARRARDEDGTAAIGGDTAAEVYDLKILVNNIEDRADNATRFLVVGRKLLAASGEDKTTIMVSTSDTTGAGVLHNLLQPLATHNVNITRIESRPSRRKRWDYVFFLDLDGHAEEPPLTSALAELEGISSLYRVLGAYPRAIR